MKKLLILLAFLASLSISAFAQSIPPTTWIEVDGSPKVTPATKIIVPNGSISGKTVTLTGGGGGGCTPPGTLGRILYDDGAGGCLSITGATTNGTVVTLTSPVLVTPAIGVATGTSLTVTGNVQVGIAALYKFGGSNSLSYTDSTGPKFTDGNTTRDLIFNVQSLSANRTVTWPDASGTVAFTSGLPAGANPTASVGLSAVNGVATTFMRSDGAPALDQSIAPTWTSAHIHTNTIALTSTTAANNKITQGAAINIGTTSTDGIILQNTTAAAAGAQQYSPRLRFTGQGWKTNATAASQSVDTIIEQQPQQGSSAPTGRLNISTSINGGAYEQQYFFDRTDMYLVTGLHITQLGGPTFAFTNNASGVQGFGVIPGSGGGAVVDSSGMFAFSSTTSLSGTRDWFLRRVGAGSVAFGAADAASPIAQTMAVQGGTGTNTNGATWTHIGSLGTSQGVPGRLAFQTGGLISASGTTTQTAVSRLELGATKVLTNNSATTIVNVTDASNTSTGGVLDYCVEVFDGTDTQYECGMATYGISNKAGAFSGNTVTKFGNHQNATSGTLTVTIAISAANPGVLSVNANSSLTPSTGYPRITYSLRNLGSQAVAVQ